MQSVHVLVAGLAFSGKEAEAAKAQKKAASSRGELQHQVGSTRPNVTMHAEMHIHASWMRSQ